MVPAAGGDEGAGGLPCRGGARSHGDAAAAGTRQELAVPPHAGGAEEGRAAHHQRVHWPQRRASIARKIRERPVLLECEGAERRRGTPSRQYWWELELDAELQPLAEGEGGEEAEEEGSLGVEDGFRSGQ